jgi:hypothetical protein
MNVKKGFFNWLTDIKEKYLTSRIKYNNDGTIKEMNTKGFRKNWFQ